MLEQEVAFQQGYDLAYKRLLGQEFSVLPVSQAELAWMYLTPAECEQKLLQDATNYAQTIKVGIAHAIRDIRRMRQSRSRLVTSCCTAPIALSSSSSHKRCEQCGDTFASSPEKEEEHLDMHFRTRLIQDRLEGKDEVFSIGRAKPKQPPNAKRAAHLAKMLESTELQLATRKRVLTELYGHYHQPFAKPLKQQLLHGENCHTHVCDEPVCTSATGQKQANLGNGGASPCAGAMRGWFSPVSSWTKPSTSDPRLVPRDVLQFGQLISCSSSLKKHGPIINSGQQKGFWQQTIQNVLPRFWVPTAWRAYMVFDASLAPKIGSKQIQHLERGHKLNIIFVPNQWDVPTCCKCGYRFKTRACEVTDVDANEDFLLVDAVYVGSATDEMAHQGCINKEHHQHKTLSSFSSLSVTSSSSSVLSHKSVAQKRKSSNAIIVVE